MSNRRFDQELETLGIRLTDVQKRQFDRYYELLIEWNRVMNLTGITEYDEVNLKHFTDSLTIVRIKDMENVSTLIDVGTGAGFPGIPIKIAFPYIKVTLLDSLNKRIKFLNQVVEELDLEDVVTLHGRAEDYAKMEGSTRLVWISLQLLWMHTNQIAICILPFYRSPLLYRAV